MKTPDDANEYGCCCECGYPLVPVWFTEEEYVTKDGMMWKTGRTRRAVDYLLCENCLHKECVDESFDKPWR